MKTSARPSRRTLALMAFNLLAIGGAAWYIVTALTAAPPVSSLEPAASGGAGAPPPAVATTWSTEAWSASPLFTMSRRPPPPPEAAAELQSLPPTPRLVGIVLNRSQSHRALLESAAGDARRLVAVDEDFGGWTVKAIERRAVQLIPSGAASSGADPITLSLPSLDVPSPVSP